MVKDDYTLKKLLHSLDGKGYASYKAIRGSYQFGKYMLSIDHVQMDPYAPPSKARVIISRKVAGIPEELLDSKSKRKAVSDFLTRAFREGIRRFHGAGSGTGNSGTIAIDSCGQEILERTSAIIQTDRIEVRIEVGLPAAGRRVLGKAAHHIFAEVLPQITDFALLYHNLDQKALKTQIVLTLDQEYIRSEIDRKRLVAFVANGSVLPRESGVSDKPLVNGIPFKSPQRLETTLDLPSGRTVTGMGLPEGITLIVGGGYHGKSTLLQALELGVYNHLPGDGRELVITRQDAAKIRAEDGRNVEKVNISAFINNLPGKKDTVAFSTENASGSTSQAANVIEALEAGTSLLLIDEDTSATNFMIRDGRMQKLISNDKEPITPFVDKIRPLYKERGVSTVLIVGGSGDYFDVADRVIMMDEYVPRDVTDTAAQIARSAGYRRELLPPAQFGDVTPRTPLRTGFSLSGKDDRFKPKGRHIIVYGKEPIDISGLQQLIDDSQTNCIAAMLGFLTKEILDEKLTISLAADRLYQLIERTGLDVLFPYSSHPGNLALPRKHELCSALNRYRGLRVKVIHN